MDLNYTTEEEAFRTDVRAFLGKNTPADLSDKVANSRKLGRDDLMRWQGILHKRGWGGPAWPTRSTLSAK